MQHPKLFRLCLSTLLLIALIAGNQRSGAWGFQVSISDFTNSVTLGDWNLEIQRGGFLPMVNGSGVFVVNDGGVQVLTQATYIQSTYQGGSTPFRIEIEHMNQGIFSVLIIDGSFEWLRVDFWDTMICIHEATLQLNCFYPFYQSDGQFHRYIIEYHPTPWNQVFVFLDDSANPPGAQLTMTQFPPAQSLVSFIAYNGDIPTLGTAVRSFGFNSDTFNPPLLVPTAAL